MIFANLKNGCKRACNLVKNSRAVRFCALVAVCLTFNVATALADSGAGYEAGKNAISQASEQIAQYVPIATKLCYAIAGVVAIVGAISVYVKMNNEEQDVKKSIMMIIGACVFLIAAAQALPLFFGIEDGVITLEFMGLRGRYITWAAITAGCAILSFIIAYSLLGFVVGLITLTVICAVGIALIILKQMKGLHTKHEFQGILIYRRDSEI